MFVFDPYAWDFAVDPYPIYARLRDEWPVAHNPAMKFWALSRYDDVLMAHRDAATFSSASGVSIEGAEAALPFLIVKDQPEHNWAKGLVVKMFSRPRMAALDIFIRKRAIELLEELYERHGPDGEFNLVSEFSVELPLNVISELLGIPADLRDEVHHLSNEVVYRGADQKEGAAEIALARMIELYTTLAAERRANPREDIISMLIDERVVDDQGVEHGMTDFEIGVRFSEMGFAGHETVAKAIPNGAMAFHHFPDERRKLADGAIGMAAVADEILRFDPPSQLQGRTTTRDVTLHGVTIPAGERVMLLTGSATRDPRAFADPDRFDISRETDPRSIFFGFGVHKCLGIHLARQEVMIATEELFSRFPDHEVDPARATRAVMSNVRGVASLPMRLGRHA